MKKISLFLLVSAISFSLTAQIDLNKTVKDIKKEGGKILNTNTNKPLSNEEVINGLKEALRIGTDSSTASASKVNGFLKNPAIKIPFPPEANKIKETVEALGMKKQVNDFVQSLNRAAEEAAKDAAPIFVNAIKQMTIGDGFSILNGSDTAATHYLKDKTSLELHDKFKPVVANAIQKVQVTKYWKPVITRYNKVPGIQKQNPDLEEYVTQRAMQGLFKLIADEELKIRKDPAARVNDILKRVFGKSK